MKKRYLKMCEKIAAFALAFALVFTSVLQFDVAEAKAATTVSITESAGWFETAYVKWSPVSGATAYKVYVKEASASDAAYVQLDNELIRQYPTYWRADALGLKAGNYVLKVEAVTGSGSVTAVTSSISVKAHDRSGFAFASGSPAASTGIGAYNNDGTLKSNASVLYVTEDTKKTVKMTINGTEYTGVAAITQAIKDKNSCQPVAIRIIGQVTLDGISCSDLSSAYAIGVKGASNVTIEGVGEDATLYTAGVAAFQSKSIEIRNLGLMNWKDDGISLKESVGVWVHNNDYFYGTAGGDADQAKGDGSMDLKDNSQYVTISYNHFWDSGKMSLCGMKSETGENWITYHHNWFDHSDSRHPRIRTMSVHVYNNYYDGNSKYGVGAAKDSEAFVEANYFRNCKYPMLSSMQGSDTIAGGIFSGENGGVIKAYNNYIEGADSLIYANSDAGTAAASSTEFDAYLASTRNENVPSSYKAKQGGSTYSNFDTSVDLGVDVSAIDAPADVPSIVTAEAGRMNGGDFTWTFDNSVDDTDYAVNKALQSKINSYSTTLVSVGGGSTTTVTKYSVKVNGGSASATSAAAGTEITITATPSSGQTFKNWTVVSGGVSLSSTTSATATFTMPSANVEITAVYDGSSSGGGSSGGGTEGDVTSGYFNHFTGQKNNNSLYTITGNYSNSKGTVTYAGTSYSECLKMESATNVSFTTTSAGTLTLVFVEVSNTGAAKVDGTKYASDANGVVTVALEAGSHTITKANTTNLFIINFEASGSSEEPEADADYTAVDAALATVPSDLSLYTDESAAAVTTAVNAVVRGKKASEQTTVDGYATAITNAVAALELKTVTEKKNGLCQNEEDGKWYYYVDDVIDTTKTGLVQGSDSVFWYVNAGVVDTTYTGFITNGAGTWYVISGKIDVTFTGLGQDGDNFIAVFDGKAYPEFTGLIQNAGYFWYVKDGTVDTTYTGFYENSSGKWYVANGKVDTSFKGLGKDGDQWLVVLGGKHSSTYTGLIQNAGAFWYVKDGVLDTTFTGITETGGASWLVATGKLRDDYTGTYTDSTGTYTVVNGKVTQ